MWREIAVLRQSLSRTQFHLEQSLQKRELLVSLHVSDAAVTAQAKQMAKKKSRKYTVVGGGLAVLLAGGAAYAAVQLFGFGDASVNASATQNLTIDNFETLTPLYPGATVGAKAIVHNPNNFPVKVTSVIIRKEGLSGKGAGCDESTLHAKGVYNANYGPGVGEGWKTALTGSAQKVIAPNSAEWVSIPEAVSQDESATVMCGFNAKIAVTAQTGN
jgi:hypothetical protein